jgi:hypothetical protein
MIVMRDTTGITVKRVIQDENHVRIGVTVTTMWVDGKARTIRTIGKPHDEHTLNELSDLLLELERLARLGK